MFDWIWSLLYAFTASILRFIDAILECTKKVCGIDDIVINGQPTNLLIYFFSDKTILTAFGVTAVCAIILLVLFTIIAFFMVAMKEKSELTISQVIGALLRNVVSFMFVPFVMICVVLLMNALMSAIFTATQANSSSLGNFLFVTFGHDCLSEAAADSFITGDLSFKDVSAVSGACDLSEFDFLLSWITGFIILIELIMSVCVFVDRTISILILFIAAPVSIASSVLDDGTRFKLWREQILVKFIIGYGVILCINIYIMLINLIMPSDVVFFDNFYLNSITKLMFIIGGALTLRKSIVLIGNLVGQGAGGQEFLNNLLSGAATPGATLSAGAGAISGAAGAIMSGAKSLGSTVAGGASAIGKGASNLFNSVKDKAGGGGQNASGNNNGNQNNRQVRPMNQNQNQGNVIRNGGQGNQQNSSQASNGNRNMNQPRNNLMNFAGAPKDNGQGLAGQNGQGAGGQGNQNNLR